MTPHRAPSRALVLLAAASLAGLQLLAGGPGPTAVTPVRAADPVYPSLAGSFFGSTLTFANTGIANLAEPALPGAPANPDPTSVTAAAGPSPLQGASILRSDLSGSELATTTVVSLHLEKLPVAIPLSTIPLQRTAAPRTWTELLAGTPYKDQPLQGVTWSQVASLSGSARPASLDALTLADIDWSGSLLANLPLAALAFGGADITTVEIPLLPGESQADDTPAARWCYLLNQAKAGSCATPADLAGKSLIAISLDGTPLKNVPLKNVPLKNVDLTASPLKNVPLKNVATAVVPLKNVPLKNVMVEGSPLKNVPLKNVLLNALGVPTATPLKNVPLKNVAWATSPLKNVPLKNVDMATSPLKNVPLKNVDFGVAPLKNVPLKNVDLAATGLGAIPLKNVDFGVAPLKNVALKNVDLAASGLGAIPLKNVALAGAPLKNVPLKNVDFGAAPLKNVPLKNVDLAASGLGALPLTTVAWTAAPLKNVPLGGFTVASGVLAAIPLAATANPAGLAPCAAATPSTCPAGATLGSLAASGGLNPNATLADVGGAGFGAAGVTLAQLLAARTATSTVDPTLGDLRLDLASAAAPAVTIGALVGALIDAGAALAPNPTVADLRVDLATLVITLGDLRLDLLASGPALSVSGLLAALAAGSPAVTLGDLRIDLMSAPPALLLGAFLAALVANGATPAPEPTLGDLRLDLLSGLDPALLALLVLDAVSGHLLNPATLDGLLVGDLGSWTDIKGRDITLGDLGVYTSLGVELTLGDVAKYLPDSVSLADVLLGLVPASQFPFEDFPVTSLGLDQPYRYVFEPPFGYTGGTLPGGPTPPPGYIVMAPQTASVRLLNSAPFDASEPVTVGLILPRGAVPGPDMTAQTLPDGRTRLVEPVGAIAPGTFGDATFTWFAGLVTGPQTVVQQILLPDGSVYQESPLTWGDAEDVAEPNSPPEIIANGDSSYWGRQPVLPANSNGCFAMHASCVGRDPVAVDDLVPGFISHPGDVDWYRLNDIKAGSRISADLTNLTVDADVVLYGPAGLNQSPTLFPANGAPLPGRLVEDSELGVGAAASSLANQSLADLRLDTGHVDTLRNNEWVAPLTPLSISQHRGTDPESVGVIAPVDGTYVIAVSGYNKSTSNDAYLLRARVTAPTSEAVCTARSLPAPGPYPAPADLAAAGPDVNALFLVNSTRLAQTYGATDATSVVNALVDTSVLLPQHGIVPLIVAVDAYPDVRAAYDAWDANPCSVAAANAVTAQLTGLVQQVRAAKPGLQYVTLVGGDDLLPMGRTPDLSRISNEAEYAPTLGSVTNPLTAAEAAGYTLTDDPYGDTNPTALGNGSALFVPRLAVGRLVEKPDDIKAQLKAYTDNQGILDTSTGLVAGYDFLADGAKGVADRLATGGRTVDRLIDQPGTSSTAAWTAADLLGKLFPTGQASPLVDSLNAHYDHTALLPSAADAGGDDPLVGAQQVRDTALADPNAVSRLAGRLLFTMGCHAGLAVPDAYLPGASADLTLDWAQALAEARVSVYVANTGYGIGDTTSIAYSEKLMALFAKLLDGSLTAGQALAYAKQAYYGSLGAVGVYDAKILQQTAFYGLPFWGVRTAPGQVPPPAPTAPSLPAPLATDTSTGLQASSFTLAPTLTERTAPDGRGTYWVVTDGATDESPLTIANRPLQPQTTVSVVTPGLVARGALITSLTSVDHANTNPTLATPTAATGDTAPEALAADIAWPGRLATITTSQAPYGTAQSLVLVPGQYAGPSTGGGVQRLFPSVGVQVLYAPASSTDATAPAILASAGTAAGTTATFDVTALDTLVTDTGSTPGTVKRVLVGVHDPNGSWQLVDLSLVDAGAGTWHGTATLSAALPAGVGVEFFVQAVDADGNVGWASAKAGGFVARVADTAAPTIKAEVTPVANPAGWTADTSAKVHFTCADAGTGIAPDGCTPDVLVTVPGDTLVTGTAVDNAGNRATAQVLVRLDGTAPTITPTVTPAANADGWSNAPSQTVHFDCADGGSGLAGACPADTVVTAEGTQTVSGTATDVAGNAASASATVRIDRTAPTITATVSPAPNAAGWQSGASATVSFACADDRSGVAACTSPVTVSAQGVTAVTGTARDKAGNATTTSFTVSLDRTAPVVTITGTAPALACSTTDALSGVAAAAAYTASTVRVNGIPTTTVTCSGATDLAGNAASAVASTFVAPIGFSGFDSPVAAPPDYNQGKAGRTYPLKFQLMGADNALISVLPAVTGLTYRTVSCSTFDGDSAAVLAETSGSSGLRYDTTSNQYIYTWKTPSAKGCYVFKVTLADGKAYTANFNLK